MTIIDILRDAGYILGPIVTVGGSIPLVWALTKFLKRWRVKKKLEELGFTDKDALNELVRPVIDGEFAEFDPGSPGKPWEDIGKAIVESLASLSSDEPTPIERRDFFKYLALIKRLLNPLNPSFCAATQVTTVEDERLELKRLLKLSELTEVWFAASRVKPSGRMITFHLGAKGTSPKGINARLSKIYDRLNEDPRIARYFGAGSYKDVPFTVWEHVPGRSLAQWICDRSEKRMELGKENVVNDIIGAIAGVHAAKIYHEHLAPDKILLSERFSDGAKRPQVQVKIADFGMGDFAGTARAPAGASGQRNGNGASCKCDSWYLPPEAGGSADDSPARRDVFAIGVIWYQLLIGEMERPPYDFAEQLADVQVCDRQTIIKVQKCLSRPNNRYANAIALRDALQPLTPPKPETPAEDEVIMPPGYFDVAGLVGEFLAASA